MKLAVIQNLPRLGLTTTTASLGSPFLSPRLSLSTRRLRNTSLTTGAAFPRRKKDGHERASLISAGTVIMAPAIEFDQFILATFFASLFALVLVFVLRRSSRDRKDDANSNRSKMNRGLVAVSSQNDPVSTEEDDSGIDVIIVGAGVAGAALAHTLGKASLLESAFFSDSFIAPNEGRRVHVIERDLSEQDRIVGELLQPGGYLKLIELGLEDCVKEIDAQRVLGYALFKDGKHTKLSYPLEAFDSDVSGRSFHNGRFVQRMRDKAATLSNVRLEQGTVTSLLEENGTVKGVQYKTKEGNERSLYAPLTVVCDGCFSNLRRSLCKPNVLLSSLSGGLVFFSNPVASTINTLAGALYKVFLASSDEARTEMREACFDYLSLGGVCSSGPVALLSGLNPRPLSLVLHFFAVAIYAVGRLMLPFPSIKSFWLGARVISSASGIIFPIIKAEGVRQMFFPRSIAALYRTPPLQ
ncbi:hypothetical protein HID58_015390 [Brassica napus]|uniref:Squalene monooxygenase n=1 Tax=Brassica napus TaxID=3708 RepID=A0ABQ8DLM7_BRANA|nr:hypothetical protein HID58_015390 [Brassica napus]